MLSNKLKVDTVSVVELAREIGSANDDIEREYQEALKELAYMFNWWDGRACEVSKETLLTIKKAFANARYTVINNYVQFLKVNVGEGYEAVENANIDLSKSFM